MRLIILLLFLASVLLSLPGSLADYDKSSISSSGSMQSTPAGGSATDKPTSTKLYGRIEEIVQGPGAQFPVVLHAQTAKMDIRQTAKLQQHGEASFSGVVVRSFPQQYTGTWGGSLKVWTSQIDPICWQIDADEANRIRQLLTSGREGTVNFNFFQDSSGTIDLEPAQVVFMVPMKDTHMQEEMNSLLGKGMGQGDSGLNLPGMDAKQVAGMMRQMANSMNVPIMVCFGNVNRSDVEGVSGNTLRASVIKNNIRQLGPGVLEQQIVTRETQRNNKTGTVRQEYAETVIRFTNQGANSLYVVAAAVNYTSDRKFERKLILYGTVRKGQVMPDMSNPLGGLNNMLPGNSQMPAGQNPFQNLFPH